MTAPVDRGSEAETLLAFQLRAVNIPFEREVQFAKPRKWRADFVVGIPEPKEPCYICDRTEDQRLCKFHGPPILIEIDGGTWTGGRHVTGRGHASDSAKRNAAVLLGYRPLTFSPEQVESGEALKTIEKALGA